MKLYLYSLLILLSNITSNAFLKSRICNRLSYSNHFFKSNWKTVSWHDSNKEDIPIICAQRGGSTLYLPQFWAVCVF